MLIVDCNDCFAWIYTQKNTLRILHCSAADPWYVGFLGFLESICLAFKVPGHHTALVLLRHMEYTDIRIIKITNDNVSNHTAQPSAHRGRPGICYRVARFRT